MLLVSAARVLCGLVLIAAVCERASAVSQTCPASIPGCNPEDNECVLCHHTCRVRYGLSAGEGKGSTKLTLTLIGPEKNKGGPAAGREERGWPGVTP